jgi:hypothetical protein
LTAGGARLDRVTLAERRLMDWQRSTVDAENS